MKSKGKNKTFKSAGSLALKKWREEHKYTLEEVADMLNVTAQCVSLWELGISIPRLHNLYYLSENKIVSAKDWFKPLKVS